MILKGFFFALCVGNKEKTWGNDKAVRGFNLFIMYRKTLVAMYFNKITFQKYMMARKY